MRQALVVAVLISLSACNKTISPEASNSDAGNSASRIAAHVRFLSDDLLEGRGVGTRGEKLASGGEGRRRRQGDDRCHSRGQAARRSDARERASAHADVG